ncbi:MAG: histidinol dehydrogenase [Puniceicoccales bacterium]|jgi:histidinol dehydrogenase|nr:histidinol dehydrogenase [Puniceicoccales bacterium]
MLKLDHKQKDFRQQLEKFCASSSQEPEIVRTVSEILAVVRERGNSGVLYYTAKFDHTKLTSRQMRVSAGALEQAVAALPAAARKAIDDAIKSIREFHKRTLPKPWEARNSHGGRVGEVFHPIRRCGLYIPGGQVPLVSTVLMTAIPAQLAGVPQLVACTPPQPNGQIAPTILAALHLCGVSEVHAVGGVQAIAAMTYGTETILPVNKIFGPGNAYVCEAKRQVFGTVGVDLLPGPSELMVIADATATPEWVAADLLAQAEHGTGKEKIYLITTHTPLIHKVEQAMEVQLASLSHAKKIREVLAKGYCVIHAPKLEQAAEIANFVAPEHLELQVTEKEVPRLARQITTAGAMLFGSHTPTVLGDFTAGPSHTLPTGCTGRFFSGLQVSDFMRRTSILEYGPENLKKAASVVNAFSGMERLDAHGRSLAIRLGEK